MLYILYIDKLNIVFIYTIRLCHMQFYNNYRWFNLKLEQKS